MGLSRRAVLRGVGATLTLPVLESLLPGSAQAQGFTPRYYVHFATDHGAITTPNMFPTIAPAQVQTTTYAGRTIRRAALAAVATGTNASVSPVVTANASVLTPALVSKLNVIHGLDIPYRVGHHFGAHMGNPNRAVNPNPSVSPRRTIDQVMAGSSGVYPSLQNIRQRSIVAGRFMSQGFANPAVPTSGIVDIAFTEDSRTWFDRLFPPGTSVGGPAPRPPIVDQVIESYRELKSSARLSAADRIRLDQHLTQLAEVQRTLNVTAPVSCTQPPRPLSNSTVRRSPSFDLDPAQHAQYFRMLNDVIAAGMACDLTRVAVVKSSETHSPYSGDWHQDVAHRPFGQQAILVAAQQRFFADVFVDLAAKLDRISDGAGGTLLDHSLLVWTQEHGNQMHHSHSVPVVTFGKAGGYFKTGNYVDYRNLSLQFEPGTLEPEYPGLVMHQFWANALQAMRVPRSEWAEADHPGYGVRHVADTDKLTTTAAYPDTVWNAAGDGLPFLT